MKKVLFILILCSSFVSAFAIQQSMCTTTPNQRYKCCNIAYKEGILAPGDLIFQGWLKTTGKCEEVSWPAEGIGLWFQQISIKDLDGCDSSTNVWLDGPNGSNLKTLKQECAQTDNGQAVLDSTLVTTVCIYPATAIDSNYQFIAWSYYRDNNNDNSSVAVYTSAGEIDNKSSLYDPRMQTFIPRVMENGKFSVPSNEPLKFMPQNVIEGKQLKVILNLNEIYYKISKPTSDTKTWIISKVDGATPLTDKAKCVQYNALIKTQDEKAKSQDELFNDLISTL